MTSTTFLAEVRLRFLFFFGIQSLSKARSLSSGFNLHNSLADSALFAHVSNVLSWAAFCHFSDITLIIKSASRIGSLDAIAYIRNHVSSLSLGCVFGERSGAVARRQLLALFTCWVRIDLRPARLYRESITQRIHTFIIAYNGI